MKTAPFGLIGGIYPEENKTLASEQPIEALPLPERLVFPLQLGMTPLDLKVVPGQHVLGGTLLAQGQGFFGQSWHAPTSGTVEVIDDHPQTHAYATPTQALVLTPDGKDDWCAPLAPLSFADSKDALLERVAWAGIAGLGGAGFPTASKLRHAQGVGTLIVNIAECEPYIACDDALTRSQSPDIVRGAQWAAHLLGATRVLFGIEDNKPQAAEALQAALDQAQWPEAELVCVPTKYPSGGEKQLIYLLTGEEIPAGQLPAKLGYHMHNPATLVALVDALERGRPLTHRLVTLTGRALGKPGNRRVALGTSITDCIDAAAPGSIARLLHGGPMMGFEVLNRAASVTKITNCLLAATAEELPEPEPELPCIRCGACAEVCPASLQPQTLFWQIQGQDAERARSEGLMDCIECGACAVVCPSHIPLVSYYRHGKDALRQKDLDTHKSDRARARFEARQARLAAEAAAKAAKRAERAKALEAAKKGQEDPRKAQIQAALARAKAKKEDSL